MRNSEKYPKTWAKFEKAKDVKAGLMALRQNFRAEMDSVTEDIGRLLKHRAHLHKLANRNVPEIYEVSKEISALAKKMGGISMKADPAGG